jgi:hypothetical protein
MTDWMRRTLLTLALLLLVAAPASAQYQRVWDARASEITSILNETKAAHPEAWQRGPASSRDTTFVTEVVIALNRAGVPAGLNGKRGSRDDISHDVFTLPNPTGCPDTSGTHPGLTLIDFVGRSETPEAFVTFIDVSVNDTGQVVEGVLPGQCYADGRFILPAGVSPPPPPPPDTTRLGASLFWLLRGYVDYRPQLDANLRWIKHELGADFVRALLVVGGDEFTAPDGERHDPWRDASVPITTPGIVDLVAQATDYVYQTHGLKVHWVLVGGRHQVQTEAAQDLVVDGVALALGTRLHAIELLEIWNEYRVNGGTAPELQRMARRLRSHLPSAPIALSSPDSVMGGNASFEEVQAELLTLYDDDSGANVVTIHPTRPEPIWNAETLGPLVELSGDFTIVVGEPRGPGASAGGDVDDPQVIAADYQSAIRAKARGYVFHSMAGVWGGHCHPAWPAKNAVANIFDHANAPAIAAALKALRHGDTTDPPPPTDIVTLLTQIRDELIKLNRTVLDVLRPRP